MLQDRKSTGERLKHFFKKKRKKKDKNVESSRKNGGRMESEARWRRYLQLQWHSLAACVIAEVISTRLSEIQMSYDPAKLFTKENQNSQVLFLPHKIY